MPGDPMKSSRERQRERTEHVEHIIRRAQVDFEGHAYPVRPEELAAEYGDQEIDLPNETESLGSVFDRMTVDEFESAEEVREAVYNELTGEAGSADEYNDERALEELSEQEEPAPEREAARDPEDGP